MSLALQRGCTIFDCHVPLWIYQRNGWLTVAEPDWWPHWQHLLVSQMLVGEFSHQLGERSPNLKIVDTIVLFLHATQDHHPTLSLRIIEEIMLAMRLADEGNQPGWKKESHALVDFGMGIYQVHSAIRAYMRDTIAGMTPTKREAAAAQNI